MSGTPIDGADGLLNELTKAVLERALKSELTHHLGDEAGDRAGRGSGNSRTGTTPKTVTTVNGPVRIDAPGDRNGFGRAGDHGEEDPPALTTSIRWCCRCIHAEMTTRDIETHLAEV